ncbi:MAG: hypothetical protein RSA96_07225 [Erysipelotrichaceae bacterium]
MEKNYHFSKELTYSVEKVWNALLKPDEIIMEKNAVYEKISNTKWIEHTSETIDNVYQVSIIENHELLIEVENSKYHGEKNVIDLKVSEKGTSCELSVHYTIGTKAIFNMISLEFLGNTIAHHISNVIMINLEKKCRSTKED